MTALANYLGRELCDTRLRSIDEGLALAALVTFAARLKAGRAEHQGPEHLQIDFCKWQGDGAHVLLTDGSELWLEVTEHARGEHRVDLECLLEPGIELREYTMARVWVRAHEQHLLARWDASCLNERWADDA